MITSLYATPIAILFVVLSARVITYRRGNRISMGDQGDNSLLKRMRAQANCAEYAPFGILLMILIEMQGVAIWAVHGVGMLLLVGRLMHGVGFSASPPIMTLRVWGMMLTLSAYLLAILVLLGLAFVRTTMGLS